MARMSPCPPHKLSSAAVLRAALVLLVAGLAAYRSAAEITCRRPVAEGVEYVEHTLPGPVRVFVIAVDRSRPEYGLRIGWPEGRRHCTRWERTSEIVARYDRDPEPDVIAAVNGSFFGKPPDVIGFTATDGEILVEPGEPARETLLWGPDRTLRIVAGVRPRDGTVRLADGHVLALDHLNRRPAQLPVNALVAYTTGWGLTTGTTRPGTAVIVDDVTYPMRSEVEVTGRVVDVRTGTAAVDTPLPARGLVLYAQGTVAAPLADGVRVGDRIGVRYATDCVAAQTADFAITGAGWIVRAGRANTAAWDDYPESFRGRHPRTFLAWNASTLYFVVLDGRQPEHSVGMTFEEMAAFATDVLHADETLNLDGGGSSTLVVDGVVRNSPSDKTGERAVCNAVLLVRRADRRP